MIQFVAATDGAGPVNEVPRAAGIDLRFVGRQVDLLQVVPEMRIPGQDAGITTGFPPCQAVSQAQSPCLCGVDFRTG